MAEKLGRLEEQFEARWKRAYEVRHLENQNRHKGDDKAAAQRDLSGELKPYDTQEAPTVAVLASAAAQLTQPAGAHSHALPSTASAVSPGKAIKQQEVEDEDDEDQGLPAPSYGPAAAPSTARDATPATAAACAAAAAAATIAAGAGDAASAEAEAEPECRVVWDSSRSQHLARPAQQPAAPSSGSAAAQLKAQGTEALRHGDMEGALGLYTAAVKAGQEGGEGPEVMAALHSNRSHVLHKLRRNEEAVAAAMEAHRLLPSWPKPLYRLAAAQLALGAFVPAVAVCLKGEGLSKKDSEGHTEFTPLLDRLAVAAAKGGSAVGFTGALLEVRDAGEEAWLGRPAPYVPELDGPEDDDSLFPATTLPLPAGQAAAGGASSTAGALATLSPSSGGAAWGGDVLASWDYRQTKEVKERRRTSFRSIKEAVTAAQDGDRILLRRGTHNGMGEAVNIDKRVMIMGEGSLGETVIDQRANSPTFRVTRGGVVIRNLDLDMSGFCEAVMVTGGPAVQPLIEDCIIRCSGDDAINVAGQADPTFRHCTVRPKRCGARCYGASRGRFEGCTFEKCGEQGVKVMERAAPTLHSCTFEECLEEGVVAMDSARATLVACDISRCKGPGVDASDCAQAVMQGGSVAGNVGGVWVWDAARATLRGVAVGGGPSHAILADGEATLDVKDCKIKGLVHATDKGWEGLLDGSNTMLDPDQPTDFPPEEGPFKFVPNRFTRKQ